MAPAEVGYLRLYKLFIVPVAHLEGLVMTACVEVYLLVMGKGGVHYGIDIVEVPERRLSPGLAIREKALELVLRGEPDIFFAEEFLELLEVYPSACREHRHDEAALCFDHDRFGKLLALHMHSGGDLLGGICLGVDK